MEDLNRKMISDNPLEEYYLFADFGDKTKALLHFQMMNWKFLQDSYQNLTRIELKTFHFEDVEILVQHNPGRYTSSSAKVDSQTIRDRKCFLCPQNLPEEQKALSFENYLILCNPYPILPEHFTIPYKTHISQKIDSNIPHLLDLSKILYKHYSIIYNGPKCGASAPDHLHFQAGSKSVMPIEKDYNLLKDRYGSELFSSQDISVYSFSDKLRRYISFESGNKEKIIKGFNFLYQILSAGSPDVEPMMNILCSFEDERWKVIVFLRDKHRPSVYYKEGAENMLISPGLIDMAGILILPEVKDFNKITSRDIKSIYNEVSLGEVQFLKVTKKLKMEFAINES